MDFVTKLFDTSDFPPRWDCGLWTPAHGWLHILSDLAIWGAYLAIPCVLIYFAFRRKDVPSPVRGLLAVSMPFIPALQARTQLRSGSGHASTVARPIASRG